MKRIICRIKIIVANVILLAGIPFLIYAHSTGITGLTLKGNTPGCTCHNPLPSPNVIVMINGPSQLVVNQAGNYSVTITGGPLVRAGTDIAVSTGILAPVSPDLYLSNSELTHSLPKAPVNNVVTFQFTYTAPPTAGNQTIYADGNSVNFDGLADPQDQWNFAPNKIVNIVLAAGVRENHIVTSFKLDQNYPNPFNPATNIDFSIAKPGNVKIEVYNSLGNKVAVLVNGYKAEGSYSISFNGDNLSSGIYFYRLHTNNFDETKKMILLK
ncbi:MAG: T9SS type A sorting domain-containing protein [Ignavibacteriaceae bacterium]